ncbi:MAG: hypothetical protein COZ96_12095 [Nitrospirae bacterium CG_4_8_14_3_um_filter_70_85]|nr:MAG: hypothetical protein COZ96_12095 [Nitrospirae bacterium CG_4_8_14_3_um_filter_70_85]HBB40444.1 hypothetical protein [Pseudomonadota bacterium]
MASERQPRGGRRARPLRPRAAGRAPPGAAGAGRSGSIDPHPPRPLSGAGSWPRRRWSRTVRVVDSAAIPPSRAIRTTARSSPERWWIQTPTPTRSTHAGRRHLPLPRVRHAPTPWSTPRRTRVPRACVRGAPQADRRPLPLGGWQRVDRPHRAAWGEEAPRGAAGGPRWVASPESRYGHLPSGLSPAPSRHARPPPADSFSPWSVAALPSRGAVRAPVWGVVRARSPLPVTTLARLNVDTFRNLASQTVSLAPGVNLVVGANGQGKTNLLEAIYLLAYQTSFRSAVAEPLVAVGCDAATVGGEVVAGGATLRLRLTVALRGRRRFDLDGTAATAAEGLAACPVILFAPTDLGAIRGGGGERRALLDRAAAVHEPSAVAVMRRYRHCLLQRNQLLRRAAAGRVDEQEHLTWEHALAAAGAALHAVRARYVAAWAPAAAAILAQISRFPAPLSIRYTGAPPAGSLGEEPTQALAAALAQRRAHDLRLGITSIGPHRDDLLLALGDLDCRRFASQGQARAVAIALRIGQVTLFCAAHATPPILLLDDLFAELDRERRERLATFLAEGGGQVVVTAVDGELPDALHPAARLQVSQGRVQ